MILASAAATAATSGSAVTSLVWAALISGSVISALVGAFVTTLLARRKSREEQLARVRVMLAEAFQAVGICEQVCKVLAVTVGGASTPLREGRQLQAR